MESKNNNLNVCGLDIIEEQIINLSNYKNEIRKQFLKEIALNLYKTLKSFGYINVERSFLKTFFNTKNNTTQNKILNEILRFLIDEKKIKKSFKEKSCIRFLRKPILSNDFNSYDVLKKIGFCRGLNHLSIAKSKYTYKCLSYELI